MMMANENQSALSPQLLECMARREAVPRHNAEKSDIFSLGITILCALTNQRIQDFYMFEKYKCKYDYVAEQLVALISRGYSKLLVGCIGNMVHIGLIAIVFLKRANRMPCKCVSQLIEHNYIFKKRIGGKPLKRECSVKKDKVHV